MAEPIDNYLVTSHAVFEMRRRGIEEGVVRRVLDGTRAERCGRAGTCYNPGLHFAGKTYLLRVFVDIDRDPAEVVTV